MPRLEPTLLAAHLRRMAAPEGDALTDGELVGRYAGRRDAAAFEVLVRRHGPMVWATCRRILRHLHDAEDAFQATFLALARTARAIGTRQAVGGWLHRVAVNAALKLKANRRTTGLTDNVPARPEGDDGEFAGAVDEELDRLPDRLRAAFVLCCLEGMTGAEAARELGCPVGTIDSRLHAARARLRDRLSRRGFGPGALAGLGAVVALPAATAAAAVGVGSGVPPRPVVDELACHVTRILTTRALSMKTVAAAVLAVAFAGAVWAFNGPGDVPAPPPGPAETVGAAPVPAGRGEGRIVLWRDGHPVAIDPGTKATAALLKGYEGKRGGLMPGPDGKRHLIYITNREVTRPVSPEKQDRLYLWDGRVSKEIDFSSSLCHAFWGADGNVYGHGLVLPKWGDPAPPADLTTEFVNWTFDPRTGRAKALKLPGNVSALDVSPDGTTFLVLWYEKDPGDAGGIPMRADPRPANPVRYRLGLLPAGGGTLTPLTQFGEMTPGDCRFSPDGRFALGRMYRTERGRELTDLVVYDLKSKTRAAVAVPKDARMCASCWSPDGKRIAYVWESQAAYEERNKDATGLVAPKRASKPRYTVTVARPDGSEAKDVYTETEHGYGYIDWRGVTAPDAQPPVAPATKLEPVGPRQPGGVLGDRLGEYLTIEGVLAEGVKIETGTFVVDTVNGKKLDKPVPIVIRPHDFNATRFDLPTAYVIRPNCRTVLKGFESGEMIGVPEGVRAAAKELGRSDVPTSPKDWQWRPYFVVYIMFEPKGPAVPEK